MNIQYLLATITQSLANPPKSDLDRDMLLDDIKQLYHLVKTQAPNTVVAKVEKTIPKTEVIDTPPPPVAKTKPLIQSISLSDEDTPTPPVEAEEIDPYDNMTRTSQQVASINDGHSKEEVSLNKKLSTEKKALNDHAASRNLKSLIDLNKQFVLTNELFNGDSAAFMDAINRIDECVAIEQAFVYIKDELLPVYHWSSADQATKLLDKLIRQKFGVM